MRFYTGKLEGTQLLFAGFEKDPFLSIFPQKTSSDIVGRG